MALKALALNDFDKDWTVALYLLAQLLAAWTAAVAHRATRRPRSIGVSLPIVSKVVSTVPGSTIINRKRRN